MKGRIKDGRKEVFVGLYLDKNIYADMVRLIKKLTNPVHKVTIREFVTSAIVNEIKKYQELNSDKKGGVEV